MNLCGLVTKIYTQRPLTATRRRGLLFLHIKQAPIKGHQDKEQKQGEKKNGHLHTHDCFIAPYIQLCA